jgi:hypothetical protein
LGDLKSEYYRRQGLSGEEIEGKVAKVDDIFNEILDNFEEF